MGNEGVVAVEKALALLDCFRPGDESLTLTARRSYRVTTKPRFTA